MTADRMKRQYVTNPVPMRFSSGDLVWYYNPRRKKGLSPKLMSKWEGPYVVVKRLNDLIYRIRQSSRGKPKVVHRNHLWKYSGTKTADWYNQRSGGQGEELSEVNRSEGTEHLRRSERQHKPVERLKL
jgi:hypothetical protein